MRNKEERNAYKCRHYFVYKRGFTLVELVVVIAVIAILAAVLIPTFASVISKANRSSDITNLHNLNEEIMTGEVNGEDIADMKPRTKGWRFKYHVPSRKLVIVDESGIIQESFNGWLNGQNSNTDDFSDLDKLTGPIGGIEGTENPGTGSGGSSGSEGEDQSGDSGSGSGGSSGGESEGSGDDHGGEGSQSGGTSGGSSGGSSGEGSGDHSGNEGSGSGAGSGGSSGSESEGGNGGSSGSESEGGGSSGGDSGEGSGSGSGAEGGSTPGGGSEGDFGGEGSGSGGSDDEHGDGGSTGKEWWENLEQVTVLPDKTTDEAKYNDLQQKTELWLNVTSIPEKYFQNNTTLERIHIGDVEKIGQRAFSGCTNLKEVIGTAVTIDEKAFEECKALIGFDFSKTKTIEKYAFTGCLSIKTAELPVIERMKDNAFDSLTIDKLVLHPCEIEIGVEGRSEFTPGFTTDALEILPGKWKDSFCIYLSNLIDLQGTEKKWSIKVRGAEDDGMKELPFKAAGENVTIDIDQGSFDNLGGDSAFNGIEVTISDDEKS